MRRQDRHTGCWREKLVSRSGRTATESCSRCRDRHPGRGGLPHQSDLGRAEFCGWGFIHHSSFFLLPSPGLGANRAVVPKPSPEGNRCKLRHEAPKALQKALYVGCSESGGPLQVVCFGWSRFPGPGSAPRIYALPIYGLHLSAGRSKPLCVPNPTAVLFAAEHDILTNRPLSSFTTALCYRQTCTSGVPPVRRASDSGSCRRRPDRPIRRQPRQVGLGISTTRWK